MVLSTLCTAFRRLALSRQSNVIARNYSKNLSKRQNSVSCSSYKYCLEKNHTSTTCPEARIQFLSGTLNIDFGISRVNNVKNIIELPLKNGPSMEEPINRVPALRDLPLSEKSLELPTNQNIIEKQAVRLIVIRRKKMKKHKLRKLRKRMQFVWAKIRQARNKLKEKLFQAELITKIQEAQKFDAKAYVAERITILQKEHIPKTWRGEILPTEKIKEFILEKKKKKEASRKYPRMTP